LLRCEPLRSGPEQLPAPGARLPGFGVAAATPPRRLELEGSHRFSTYRLVFVLYPLEPAGCRLRAETWAAFPGRGGRIYRALVIGMRGHVLVVLAILAAVGRASRAGTEGPAHPGASGR
ncbi:MAG TPA: hypothetical protein VGF15_01150, partial [Solirubrobacteraceae bacterium]